MEFRVLKAVIGSIVVAVFCKEVTGVPQCGPQSKCIPFNDCEDFKDYVGVPHASWPVDVKSTVKSLLCGRQQCPSGTVYKICCKTTVVKSGRELLDLRNCGRQDNDRIAHGNIAKVFDYPWMALLRGDEADRYHCGGSLIAAQFVLTAAHCGRNGVRYVRLGETDLSTPIDCLRFSNGEEDCAAPPQDIKVEKFIKHCNYSTSQKKNDIALVKLERPAQLNDNVRPICLPLPEIAMNELPQKMLVAGWGYTEDELTTSNQLRFANIPVLDPSQCNHSLRRMATVWTVDESQVCAGAGEDMADNCQGDSGGPLKYFAPNGYVIHGVVSFGQRSCGAVAEPGVYTKVAHYLEWILDNLK